jgi:hypothetical protein
MLGPRTGVKRGVCQIEGGRDPDCVCLLPMSADTHICLGSTDPGGKIKPKLLCGHAKHRVIVVLVGERWPYGLSVGGAAALGAD